MKIGRLRKSPGPELKKQINEESSLCRSKGMLGSNDDHLIDEPTLNFPGFDHQPKNETLQRSRNTEIYKSELTL